MSWRPDASIYNWDNPFEEGADAMGKSVKPKLDAFDALVEALKELLTTGFHSEEEYDDWMAGARARGREVLEALAKAQGKEV